MEGGEADGAATAGMQSGDTGLEAGSWLLSESQG